MADPRTTPTRVTYTGTDRPGTARTGSQTVDALNLWVESKYRAGWKTLRVFDYADRRLVAEILPDYAQPFRRTWWSEVENSRV